MSEIELIQSPLILAGLGLSLAGSLVLFSYYRDVNTSLLVIGFLVVVITKVVENYCVRASMLSIENADLSFLCSPAVPHIKGSGYLLIAAGLILHVAKIRNSQKDQ